MFWLSGFLLQKFLYTLAAHLSLWNCPSELKDCLLGLSSQKVHRIKNSSQLLSYVFFFKLTFPIILIVSRLMEVLYIEKSLAECI